MRAPSTALTAPILVMECLDEVTEGMDHIVKILDEYGEKISSLGDVAISDTQRLQQVIEQLPSDRAAALVRAVECISQLITESERDQDIVEILERRFKLVSDIRTHLHLALEDDSL